MTTVYEAGRSFLRLWLHSQPYCKPTWVFLMMKCSEPYSWIGGGNLCLIAWIQMRHYLAKARLWPSASGSSVDKWIDGSLSARSRSRTKVRILGHGRCVQRWIAVHCGERSASRIPTIL